MNSMRIETAVFALLTILALVAQQSWAAPGAEDTTTSKTFTVENMTCAACPITVRKAMSRVDGVKTVDVNFDDRTVTVTFDPTVADTAAISEASTSVGFPAFLLETP